MSEPPKKVRQSKFERLSQKRRDEAVRDIVLGRKSMHQVAKEANVNPHVVGRYMQTRVTEEMRLHIVAAEAERQRREKAEASAEVVNALGEDITSDLKFILSELALLLREAKGDYDRVMSLGTLKEMRQSLMALADLTGKLNRRVEVSFELHESPAFLELRSVILDVLENHPEAKADFVERMGRMRVVQDKQALKKLQ